MLSSALAFPHVLVSPGLAVCPPHSDVLWYRAASAMLLYGCVLCLDLPSNTMLETLSRDAAPRERYSA